MQSQSAALSACTAENTEAKRSESKTTAHVYSRPCYETDLSGPEYRLGKSSRRIAQTARDGLIGEAAASAQVPYGNRAALIEN